MMEHSGARQQIVPLDPDSPAGRQAAEELSEVLAHALLRIQRERKAGAGDRKPGGYSTRSRPVLNADG